MYLSRKRVNDCLGLGIHSMKSATVSVTSHVFIEQVAGGYAGVVDSNAPFHR